MTQDSTDDPSTARAEARVGSVLREKWRLDRLLGLGGMAAVYAATHRNGARGAIKVLHPELSHNEQVRKRFLREGYLANTVDHPGVVRVLDDDVTEDGAVFLVMELLEGETLEARAARFGGKLPPSEVLHFADQLLDVLVAAHRIPVIHRDIKPENLFVTRAGAIKLLDFGIARAREVAKGMSFATMTGSTMGTPAYMPPEQALGETDQIDAQSDLWAAGATMFALLSGDIVHEATTVNALLVAAATKPARSLAAVTPGLPREVVAVVDRALAFDKRGRWPDAATMQSAVRAAREAAGGPSVVSFAPPDGAPAVSAMSATISAATTARVAPRRVGALVAAVGLGAALSLAAILLVLAARSTRSGTAGAGPTTVAAPGAPAAPAPSAPPAAPASSAPSVAPTAGSGAAPVSAPSAAPEPPAAPSARRALVPRLGAAPAATHLPPPPPHPPSIADPLDRQH